MTQDKRGMFAQIFMALMVFCGLVWVWTVAFILAWPWEKTAAWKPEFRLPAVCADGEVCGIPYGQLDAAKAKGRYSSLAIPDDTGAIVEPEGWLQWKKTTGQPWQIEAKSSSWYFQTVIRYRLDQDVPVLIEYQDVSAKAFYFGIGAGLLTLIGLYLRRLRH